jgi:reactive intermediate/imine deaminase
MKNVVLTPHAPTPLGPYSQAVKTGRIVYFSGQIAMDPATFALVSTDFRIQVETVFRYLRAVSEAAGGNLDAIVKITLYLTDLANFSIVNDVMKLYFREPYPARSTVQISALPQGALIEVDAIMCLDS